MPTYEATVDAEGRVRLPDDLRARLAIAPGDRVEFFATHDGHVSFHAINRTWDDLGFGTDPTRHPGSSMQEIDDAIADHAADDDARIVSEAEASRAARRSAAE